MKISIEHHGDQFNVGLASKEGAEPFLVIKGCRIKSGANGDFVSWPSRKKDDGKYWSHVYATDKFQAAVIAEARKGKLRDEDNDSPPF